MRPPQTGAAQGAAKVPTNLPKPSAAPARSTPYDTRNNINAFYDQQLGAQEESWKGQEQLLQGQQNQRLREADVINARMGRGIGGGYANIQAAANAAGMNEMQKAWLSNQEAVNALKRDQFGALTDERQRQEERSWQTADQEKRRRDDMMRTIFENTGEVPSEGLLNYYMQGGGGSSPGAQTTDSGQETGKRNRGKSYTAAKTSGKFWFD